MARPSKQGLDYFPLDIDFFNDPKIRHIIAKFGSRGVVVILQLYCRIYRSGYFIEWSEDELRIFAKYDLGLPVPQVKAIIEEALNRSIFDKQLFEKFNILTSGGIQKRYFEASIKRLDINLVFEYVLIKHRKIDTLRGVISEKTKVNAESTGQIETETETETEIENKLSETDFNILFNHILNSLEYHKHNFPVRDFSTDDLKRYLKNYLPGEIKGVIEHIVKNYTRYEDEIRANNVSFLRMLDKKLPQLRLEFTTLFNRILSDKAELLKMPKQLTIKEMFELSHNYEYEDIKSAAEDVEDHPNYRKGQSVFVALKKNLDYSKSTN